MARTIDRASRVISGTWGSVWLDDEALVETTALQAKFNKNKEKVYLCGQFVTDSKAMSADGTGSTSGIVKAPSPAGVRCSPSSPGSWK